MRKPPLNDRARPMRLLYNTHNSVIYNTAFSVVGVLTKLVKTLSPRTRTLYTYIMLYILYECRGERRYTNRFDGTRTYYVL